MGLREIQLLHENAKLPKEKKIYHIPKQSAKRKKQVSQDKVTFEEDKIFYKEHWDSCPHKCEECGTNLGREALTLFFHHLLPKSKYPMFRHTHENIVVLCPDCHSQAESNISKLEYTKNRTLQAVKELLK